MKNRTAFCEMIKILELEQFHAFKYDHNTKNAYTQLLCQFVESELDRQNPNYINKSFQRKHDTLIILRLCIHLVDVSVRCYNPNTETRYFIHLNDLPEELHDTTVF